MSPWQVLKLCAGAGGWQEAMLRMDSMIPLVVEVINNCLLEYIFLLLQGQRITEVNSQGSVSWTLSVPRSVAVRGQSWTAPTKNSPDCPLTSLNTPLTCKCGSPRGAQLDMLAFGCLKAIIETQTIEGTSYFYPCVKMGKLIIFQSCTTPLTHFLSIHASCGDEKRAVAPCTSHVSSSNAGQAQAVSFLSNLPWSPLSLHLVIFI